MEILEFLQGIRNPILDAINMVLTNLGSEIIVIGVVCWLFWCMDKKYAYRLGFVYFMSGLAVQTLKIIFRVPRPWLLNKNIKPVEAAIDTATGYSFPSGHTQGATALFGTVAYNSKKRIVQIAMLALILVVVFTRLYLGVHTPMDVSVSMLVSLIILIITNLIIDKKLVYKLKKEVFTGILLMIPMAMIIYGIIVMKEGSVNEKDILDYLKAAGAALGFVFGWYFETEKLNFDEKAGGMKEKVLRYVIGIILLLGIKEGLKLVIGNGLAAGFVRYAIVLLFGLYIYPLIFTKIRKSKA